MHKDCIILCHSTNADGDLHCLEDINGKPFITYVAKYLQKFHVCKVIFSLSVHKEKVKEAIANNRDDFSFAFDFAEQKSSSNSGAAILHALQYSDTPDVLIMNGHCFFDVNIDDLIAWQQTKMGDVTMALSYQENTECNVTALLNEEHIVHEFKQGSSNSAGLIVSGMFCMFRPSFLNVNFPHQFSFINDYLLTHLKERDFIGMVTDSYYLDITIEGMKEKACKEFPVIFKPTPISNDKN